MKKKTRQFQYHQTLKQCDLTKKEQVHGTLVNSGLYWIEEFFNGNSFTPLFIVSLKELKNSSFFGEMCDSSGKAFG
jgi:hypothetical protein